MFHVQKLKLLYLIDGTTSAASPNTKEDKISDFTVEGSGAPKEVTSEEIGLENATSDPNTPMYNIHTDYSHSFSSFSSSDLSSHRKSSQNPVQEDE